MQRLKSPRVWLPLIFLVIVIAIIVPTYVFAVGDTSMQFNDSPTQFQCTGAAPYSGVIDSIDTQKNVAKLYDPRVQSFDPQIGRVSLIVSTEAATRVYQLQGNTCTEVSFSALQTGQTLRVWSRLHPVMEMFPTPITASEIVIVL